MKKKNLKILLAAFLTLSTIMTSIGLASGQTQPKYGGTMIVALNTEPKTLNTADIYDNMAMRITRNIATRLVKYDMGFNIIPDLAESWEISPDSKEYTFHLVRNAVWTDGVKTTSADVKYTLETIIAEKHFQWEEIADIERIETPDDYTVKIFLKVPNVVLLARLCDVFGDAFIMLPKHLYEGTDWSTNPYNEKPVTNGPFKFVEWVKGSHITIEANEN